MRNLAIGCAIAAVAFVAGRQVPRSAPRAAPAPATVPTRSASPVRASSATAVAPVSSGARLGASAVTATVFTEWADAVRDDPAAARRTYDAVLLTLESRRHLGDEIEACVEGLPGEEALRLRFAVTVTATGREVAIGDARFVAAASGAVDLGAEAVGCLERHLAGADRLPAESEPFLDGYRGRVEYVAAFAPARARASAQRAIDAGPGR